MPLQMVRPPNSSNIYRPLPRSPTAFATMPSRSPAHKNMYHNQKTFSPTLRLDDVIPLPNQGEEGQGTQGTEGHRGHFTILDRSTENSPEQPQPIIPQSRPPRIPSQFVNNKKQFEEDYEPLCKNKLISYNRLYLAVCVRVHSFSSDENSDQIFTGRYKQNIESGYSTLETER